MVVTAGLGASLRLEIGVSWTEAARPKTKARRREYVGEARKRSWSAFERMRRLGFVKVNAETSGGGGRAGVSGTGSGFTGGGCRRRGWSFGRRSLRFGMLAACLSGAGGAGAVFSMLDGILMGENMSYLEELSSVDKTRRKHHKAEIWNRSMRQDAGHPAS